MEQTLHSPSYGSQKPPQKEKIKKKIFLTSYLDPLKKWFFACFTLFLGVRKYFFFIQSGANFAQPLLWILRTPSFKKKMPKNIFDLLFGPFKNVTFFAHFTLLQGVRKDFIFIQNGANFAKPPLIDPKNHSILKKFCSFYAFPGSRYVNTFFSSKMEQTLQSLSYGS